LTAENGNSGPTQQVVLPLKTRTYSH